MQTLKSFDLAVALKIGLNEKAARSSASASGGGNPPSNSVGGLAESLFKAKGDVSRAINRLLHLGLLSEREPREHDVPAANRKYYSVHRSALANLLCFGVRHIFGAERRGYGRGMATGWNCPHIKSPMNPLPVPLVWAMPGGDAQGELIEPLYLKCPQAALGDQGLYELLSLVEVLRTGKPRELQHAKRIIQAKVKELHS